MRVGGKTMQKLLIEAGAIHGLKGRRYEKYGAVFDECRLDKKLADKLGRRQGNYLTVQTDRETETQKALKYALGSFVGRGKRALVVGFGNGDVVADALGSKVVRHLKKKGLAGGRISVFAPDVGALTNLDSVKLVQAVADGFEPDYVIAVDALATSRAERLGTCFQFTDSALRPGGGIGKGNVLDPEELGSRLIAIGVPFIVSASDLGAKEDPGYYVPYDADKRTDVCAKLIAEAVCDCF